MIPEADSNEFQTGIGNFATLSCWKPLENCRIWKQEYDAHIQWPIMFGFDWFSLETEKPGH